MWVIRRKKWIVFTTFIYLVYLESLTSARPEQTNLNATSPNFTFQNGTVSSTEKVALSLRILSPPKNRRGGVAQKFPKFSTSSNQAIIFPDEDSSEDDSIVITPFKPHDKPLCAKGTTFCEKVDGYPKDLVERMLKVPSPLDDLFGIDDGPDEIANRLGDDTDISLCQSEEKTMFPKYGKTKNNKWKYIVNQDDSDKYVQGIRVEICTNPGQTCSLLSNETLGYTSYCKQKYVYRRLITPSYDGRVTTDIFEVPSACCCSYRKIPLDNLSFE